MKRLRFQWALAVLFALWAPLQAHALDIRVKMGTLGPKGSSVTLGSEIYADWATHAMKSILGHKVTITGYYGGVMGDDPQMVQKAQMGQLDMITPTINVLPRFSKDLEVLYIAYLIDNYGQLDYIGRKMAKHYNEMFYKMGWIQGVLPLSEGKLHLFMDGPYKTPEALRKNLKAANFTGEPDNTFYKPLGIPQTPIFLPDMFTTLKLGLANAISISSTLAVGTQAYTVLRYIMDPSVRMSISTILVTKRWYDSMPPDVQFLIWATQPLVSFWLRGLMQDGAEAYMDALYRYGCQKVALSPKELEAIKKPVLEYRETYLGNDKTKRAVYNRVTTLLKEYETRSPIEKKMHEADPSYASFPVRLKKISEALRAYIQTGSKAELARLDQEGIVPALIGLDLLNGAETYVDKGDLTPLKAWMSGFAPSEVVDNFFTNHPDTIKKLLGSKEMIRHWASEILYLCEHPRYKGFHKEAKAGQ